MPRSGIILQWHRARCRTELCDMRHTFIGCALALGESKPTIARLLGHASV